MDTTLRRSRAARLLQELTEFLSIPSVSTLPAHAADCRRGRRVAAGRARRLGCPVVDLIEGHGPPGRLGREPARAGPADAAHLRPLRRSAARSARRVGHAAVRAHRPGRQALRARRRRRQGPGLLPAQGVRGGARRRCAGRRSTSTSSSRARRSAAGTSSSTCSAPSRSAPGPTPCWSATCRTTRRAGPPSTPRCAASATPRSRCARCSATCTPAPTAASPPTRSRRWSGILAGLKDEDGEIQMPKLYKAVEPPTQARAQDLEASCRSTRRSICETRSPARPSPGSRSIRSSSGCGRCRPSRSTASAAASSARGPRPSFRPRRRRR